MEPKMEDRGIGIQFVSSSPIAHVGVSPFPCLPVIYFIFLAYKLDEEKVSVTSAPLIRNYDLTKKRKGTMSAYSHFYS